MSPHPPVTTGGVLLGADAGDALLEALGRFGVLCGGCDRPAADQQSTWPAEGERPSTPRGYQWEFMFLRTKVEGGAPTVSLTKQVACGRPDCEQWSELMAAVPAAFRILPGWQVPVYDPSEDPTPPPSPES